MKTILSIARTMSRVVFIALTLFGCNDESISPERMKEFTLNSVYASATYQVRVGLPVDYDPTAPPYKTVYVLDGEEIFGVVTNRCRELSGQLSVPNVVVVSIGYGNTRELDYTPTLTGSGTGGAANFMRFIAAELIPEVQKRYNVDTTRSGRTILGHSYGGLLGVYAFTKSNEVFGNYIMLSPSIWYDNEVTLQYESEGRTINKTRKQLVFLGQGEMENSGRMQAPCQAFYQILAKNYVDSKVAMHLENGLDHVGSRNPNIVHGLRFYFENQLR
jgi:predicted alpha/beta superfamily hydrolase